MTVPSSFPETITELDDDVVMLGDYIVAYSYLDEEGEQKYGVRWGGEGGATSHIGLTVVAQHHMFARHQEDDR